MPSVSIAGKLKPTTILETPKPLKEYALWAMVENFNGEAQLFVCHMEQDGSMEMVDHLGNMEINWVLVEESGMETREQAEKFWANINSMFDVEFKGI
jgi:hypothetical protein